MGLFEQMGAQRAVRLFTIPRALVTQGGHQRGQPGHLC